MYEVTRVCPLCAATDFRQYFPWAFLYEGQEFCYYRCTSCKTVYLNPIPSREVFASIYSKSAYHDIHYFNRNDQADESSMKLLRKFASSGASVLDYGCGSGHFLRVAVRHGFECYGVEFDLEIARAAAELASCNVLSLEQFVAEAGLRKFDLIHLGDVLEHLPDPAVVVGDLISRLKPNGILLVEGPLEGNASLVYWSSFVFGWFKRHLRPSFIGRGVPSHLYRTDSSGQLSFFCSGFPMLELLHWDVHETGWPYRSAGRFRDFIAQCAIMLGGKRFFGSVFGNRFTGVFRLLEASIRQ